MSVARPGLAPAPTVPGTVTGEADLSCTYAAVRTLRWLGRIDAGVDVDRTAAYLAGRRNSDGGYGWLKGMPSDAWATFHCTQALTDLGVAPSHVDKTAAWLRGTWSGEAYAMRPGQEPDVWATHLSTQTVVDVCGSDVPDRAALLRWLGGLQSPEGGLGWSRRHARAGRADVRACYYGIAAWHALRDATPPWDVPALVGWLREQQSADGGFRFSPDADVPCMWATYRATAALSLLDAAPAHDAAGWVSSMHGDGGAFVRWRGYQVEDVWAAFCAVGSLRAVGAPTEGASSAVAARIGEAACRGGGYTYRERTQAADALTTASLALVTAPGSPVLQRLRRWLESCQLPNEGGVMYMPARGSEVRCTLWALAAGAFARDPASRLRIAAWLRSIQNFDGGFGYWEGRGSDLVCTAAAVEITGLLGRPLASTMDTARLASFLRGCSTDDGRTHGDVPGGTPSLRSSLQALRIWNELGRPDPEAVADLLARHRVGDGGFAGVGNKVADLLSTYEAVVASDRHSIPVDTEHLAAFLDRASTATGTSWTPLAAGGGGPLADCLAELLRRRVQDHVIPVPALTLS